MGQGSRMAFWTARKRLLAAGIVVLLLASYLRVAAGADTVIDEPFRGDAAHYYITAYNINTYGVYSHVHVVKDGVAIPPPPDAFLTPGYPLFLALFVDAPPNLPTFRTVTYWQQLLGVAAVALILILLIPISPWVSASAALLAAISPHLITVATYMLSETLFSVLLLLSLLVIGLHTGAGRWRLPVLIAGGVLLGIAALTRPVLELFPLAVVFLLWVSHDRRTALRGSAALLLGFCLTWAPWIARNEVSLGRAGDPANMTQTIVLGMYPDLEYDHIDNHGAPNRLDPHFTAESANLSAAFGAIVQRFREDTAEELRWYLLGKPLMLWSWHDLSGSDDVFIYGVLSTPYWNSVSFRLTHALMYGLHWPLVILALAGCLLVWLPQARGWLTQEALLLTRLMSLLLLYNTAVLMVLAPLVRYSIPFLPIQYGMAATALYIAARWWRQRATGASVRTTVQ